MPKLGPPQDRIESNDTEATVRYIQPASGVTPPGITWHAETLKFWLDAEIPSASRIPAGIFTFDGFPAAELGYKDRKRGDGMSNKHELSRDPTLHGTATARQR